MLDRLSQAARGALDRARTEASALGHGSLSTAHVLLGLVGLPSGEGGAGALALRRRGAGYEPLRAKVAELFPPEGVPGAGAGTGRSRTAATRAEDVHPAGDRREAFALARDAAEARGSFDVRSIDLFRAVTADDDWPAAQALAALGVRVEEARREAESLLRQEIEGTLPSM